MHFSKNFSIPIPGTDFTHRRIIDSTTYLSSLDQNQIDGGLPTISEYSSLTKRFTRSLISSSSQSSQEKNWRYFLLYSFPCCLAALHFLKKFAGPGTKACVLVCSTLGEHGWHSSIYFPRSSPNVPSVLFFGPISSGKDEKWDC